MVTIQDETGSLTNGKLRADIWPDGTLHFFNIATGAVLLEEQSRSSISRLPLVSPAPQRPVEDRRAFPGRRRTSVFWAWGSTSTACWTTRAV